MRKTLGSIFYCLVYILIYLIFFRDMDIFRYLIIFSCGAVTMSIDFAISGSFKKVSMFFTK